MFRFHLRNVPLVEEIKYYEVTWEGEPLSIEETIQRIQNGYFPQGLVIYHPTYGTVNFSLFDNVYMKTRSGPPLNGTRGGIARTFANQMVDKEYLLQDINEIFGDLAKRLSSLQIGRQKALRLQTEVARKLMRNSGQNVPRNVEQGILELIGAKKPVKSSFNILNNQARIQTNLFTNEVVQPRHLKKINTTLFNGGKRRGKATRRRTTRRRR
jgi:hypothetical protein